MTRGGRRKVVSKSRMTMKVDRSEEYDLSGLRKRS